MDDSNREEGHQLYREPPAFVLWSQLVRDTRLIWTIFFNKTVVFSMLIEKATFVSDL